MKNIGILTQPLRNNYGGTLQNYALQEVLRNLGYNPITLNYDNLSFHDILNRYFLFFYKLLHLEFDFGLILSPLRKKNYTENFRIFESKHIKKENVGKGIVKKEKVDSLNLDAIIVGSDQTWRPAYNKGPLLGNMFLDFYSQKDIVKISYAASFGLETPSEFNPKQIELFSTLLKAFKAVSVREKSAVSICKNYFGVEASQVLDPTLLLSRDKYESLCNHIDDTDYVAVYILDLNSHKKSLIEQICQKLNKKAIFIGTKERNGFFQSIEDWLGYIKNSKFLITDSFHGTVFAIIFNIPFLNLFNNFRGKDRVNSLCSLFELTDHLLDVNSAHDFNPSLSKEINWRRSNNLLNQLQSHSFDFLKKSLNN